VDPAAAARRALGWPLRRVLDRRVEWILAALAEQTGYAPGRQSLHQRLDRIEGELAPAVHDLAAHGALVPADGTALSPGAVELLNWAQGPDGPAARAGVWFNPPVPVRYTADGAEVLFVNERIVEQPYVHAAIAAVPAPARVLDVGGGESTVALSLASLGHQVHVVDPRGYQLSHPGVRVHAVPLHELAAGPPFQLALALSSIEHFGLGSYGQAGGERLDLAALVEIRRRLAPGGLLVLTVPCGRESSVDGFQRVYTVDQLRQLLADWELIDLTVVWQRDRLTWTRADPGEPAAERGVALLTARAGS
jgi:SAM-dependent methyltransferase